MVAAVFFTAVFLAPDPPALLLVDFLALVDAEALAGEVLAGVFLVGLFAALGAVFFAAAFLAVVFFVAVFFAGPFFAAVFSAAFFPVVFLAVLARADDFFTPVDVAAGAFLGAAFLAGAFLAGAFLAAALVVGSSVVAFLLVEAFLAVDVLGVADRRVTVDVTRLAAAAVFPASFLAAVRAMPQSPQFSVLCGLRHTRCREDMPSLLRLQTNAQGKPMCVGAARSGKLEPIARRGWDE